MTCEGRGSKLQDNLGLITEQISDLGCPRIESLIFGADVAETEKLRLGMVFLQDGRGIVQITGS